MTSEFRAIETVRLPTRPAGTFARLLDNVREPSAFEIEATLYIPEAQGGNSSLLPLVIVSVGSLGVTLYANALAAAGIATMVVDGFRTRRIEEIYSGHGRLPFADSVADVFFALQYAQNDSRLDPLRIALLGYSRDGTAAVLSYDKRLQRALSGQRPSFCAYIALYPASFLQWEHLQPLSTPLLVILGGRDEIAPAPVGRAYTDRLAASGCSNVEVLLLPEAVQSFDAAILWQSRPASI